MSMQGSWLVLLLLGASSATSCPDGRRCEGNNTCCTSPDGTSACCPPAHAVMCPDQASECPDETTCCQLPDLTWGCCPMAKAVCCEDKLHCCPEGTQCDLSHSRCVSLALGYVPMLEKLPARRKPGVGTASVMCPGGKSRCPKDSTCCLQASGDYGCCPYPEAICCSDHLHCCPEGYNCDLVHSMCVSTNTSLTHLTYAPAKTPSPVTGVKVHRVRCNESVTCADETTCCQTTAGAWACCPMPEAVCCQDHLHCCPHGTICNLAHSRCDAARGHAPSVPWLNKLPVLSLSAREEVATVTSSDEKCDYQTMCPGGSTCCRKSSGPWACCPLPQAVCCNDLHCCPEGSRCNLAQQSCDGPGSSSLPWVRKFPALPRADPEPSLDRLSPARVTCDARTSCPRDTTCCFMKSSGLWGCCPLPKAVCCADGEHCCPSGYTCDARTASCSKPRAAGLQHLPWFSKDIAVQHGVQRGMLGDVKCDNASSCASGTTCCKLATGEWGCCPLVKAVCCDDHEHCCPQGYTCNMHSGTCEKQHRTPRSRPQSKVVRSMLRQSAVEEGVPCDAVGAFRCSKQETCCRTSAAEWACCPSAQAVCCADSQHCCPAGSSCDQAVGGCTPQSQPSRPPHRWDGGADLVPLGL